MARISMKDISPELTLDEIKELENAELLSPVHDDDCPEMTISQLLEFKPFHNKRSPKANRLAAFISIDTGPGKKVWARIYIVSEPLA